MVITYKTRKLEKSLTDPKEMNRTYGYRAKKINQRLKEIKAAATLAVLKTIPAANCHLLKADRSNQFAVDVSANWRIIFEPNYYPVPSNEDGSINWSAITKIIILEVTDYH
jgi:proteic killer suppression protein